MHHKFYNIFIILESSYYYYYLHILNPCSVSTLYNIKGGGDFFKWWNIIIDNVLTFSLSVGLVLERGISSNSFETTTRNSD